MSFLKKLFGKRDDDDDDDDDFDLDDELEEEESQAEVDELNEALEAQSVREAGEDTDLEAGLGGASFDDLPPEGAENAAAGSSAAGSGADDVDPGGDSGSDAAPDAEDDGLDVDLDDYDDDLDDYDDDDDDDEVRGGFFGNPAVRYGLIGFVLVLLVGGGGLYWFMSFSGGGLHGVAAVEGTSRGMALPPVPGKEGTGQAAVSSLNDLSTGGGLQPPAAGGLSVDGSAGANVAATPTDNKAAQFASQPESGLNALGGGLNAMSPGSTGSGVVVPMTTAASYSRYPDLPRGEELSAAPEADLIEMQGNGLNPLPHKGKDNRSPFSVYKRPAEIVEGQAYVSIVATDMGLNRAGTIAAIRKLPPEVTLSFSPYAEELDQWLVRARRAGHEALVELPMESSRFPVEDPGPEGLMTALSPEQNMKRLLEVISSCQGHIGVEVVLGDRFTDDADRIRPLLKVLGDRGLMILDEGWNKQSDVPAVARELRVPLAISDLRLDTVMARSAIDAKLKQLEDMAESRKSAIGTTTITPAMVDRLSAWFITLKIRNIRLVPLSALAVKGNVS